MTERAKYGAQFYETIRLKGGKEIRAGDVELSDVVMYDHKTGKTTILQAKHGRIAATPTESVPRAEFDSLRRQVEALTQRVEDLEDALDAQAARAAADPADTLPVELVKRMIEGESPVRIWREHRGLALTALAERAEIPPGYLSEIEHRKKPGSVRALRALARALNVDLDDLVRDPKDLADSEHGWPLGVHE